MTSVKFEYLPVILLYCGAFTNPVVEQLLGYITSKEKWMGEGKKDEKKKNNFKVTEESNFQIICLTILEPDEPIDEALSVPSISVKSPLWWLKLLCTGCRYGIVGKIPDTQAWRAQFKNPDVSPYEAWPGGILCHLCIPAKTWETENNGESWDSSKSVVCSNKQ